jgi:hypothetical protein
MTELPPSVYRVAQRRFDVVPSSPWVYWISNAVRALFETLPQLETVAEPRQGLATADNFRFLRYWWEVGWNRVASGCQSSQQCSLIKRRWFPHMKGGQYCKWYGNQEHVINYHQDGYELKAWADPLYGNSGWSRIIKSVDRYFCEGVTFTDLTSGGLSLRWMPPGFVFDHAGNCLFPKQGDLWAWLALLNSRAFDQLMHINPTIHFYISDFRRMPVSLNAIIDSDLASYAQQSTHWQIRASTGEETTFDFIAPHCWDTGLDDLAGTQARLAALEAQIDDEVYRLYGIGDEDRAAIEAELAGEPLISEEDGTEHATRNTSDDEEGDTEGVEPPMTEEELAVRWISYAVGVVLGRFEPGVPGALGSAVYHREDFAVGSLSAPDEAEFDQLVGPPGRFAYVDADGGRHVFPARVEAALRDLAVPDGITVLDEGHERDLPTLVERALHLMLDWDTEHATRNTRQVIEIGAGGDLRKFLERDFFTRWHFRWYRKRPVYWPLQSARRTYGFVLFHERINKSTVYALQRDYLDHKLNGLRLQIGDLRGQAEPLSGATRKRVERQMDRTTQQLDEITEFATTMERAVREGYKPAPDWIDDGVILRLAPLWELSPIWKSEPKKYWGRLERGDYDWSHIAMNYWPERVKEACRTNKSFAIAHGHEEWYQS